MKQCSRCGQPRDGLHSYCRACRAKQRAEWREANPGQDKEARRAYSARLKHTVLQAYGGVCSCCGEAEEAFLTIDHINDDGAQHRRDCNIASGSSTYQWLKRYHYPEGFQVLCANCNQGKQLNGGICPHKAKVE